jgi:hypothetical protein
MSLCISHFVSISYCGVLKKIVKKSFLTSYCIEKHSRLQNKGEVLLLRSCCFEVTSQLDAKDGFHIIAVKEIDPPYDLY